MQSARKHLICLIVFGFTWNTSFGETDSLYVVATTLLIVDWAQTRSIVNNQNYQESNTIMGRTPSRQTVDAYFATATLATFLINEHVSKRNKKRLLYGLIALETAVVSRNFQLGVRIKF